MNTHVCFLTANNEHGERVTLCVSDSPTEWLPEIQSLLEHFDVESMDINVSNPITIGLEPGEFRNHRFEIRRRTNQNCVGLHGRE